MQSISVFHLFQDLADQISRIHVWYWAGSKARAEKVATTSQAGYRGLVARLRSLCQVLWAASALARAAKSFTTN